MLKATERASADSFRWPAPRRSGQADWARRGSPAAGAIVQAPSPDASKNSPVLVALTSKTESCPAMTSRVSPPGQAMRFIGILKPGGLNPVPAAAMLAPSRDQATDIRLPTARSLKVKRLARLAAASSNTSTATLRASRREK